MLMFTIIILDHLVHVWKCIRIMLNGKKNTLSDTKITKQKNNYFRVAFKRTQTHLVCVCIKVTPNLTPLASHFYIGKWKTPVQRSLDGFPNTSLIIYPYVKAVF